MCAHGKAVGLDITVGAVAEWVRASTGDRTVEGSSPTSENFSLRNFGNSVYPAVPVSFGGDSKSRRSLLSGVYARGSKRSWHRHQSALGCVTVVDPPEVHMCGGKRCPALKEKKKNCNRIITHRLTLEFSEGAKTTSSVREFHLLTVLCRK